MTDSKTKLAKITFLCFVAILFAFLGSLLCRSDFFKKEEEPAGIAITAPYSEWELFAVTGIRTMPESMRELHTRLSNARFHLEMCREKKRAADLTESPTVRSALLKRAMDSLLLAEEELEKAASLQEMNERDIRVIVSDAYPEVLDDLMTRPEFAAARNDIESLGSIVEKLRGEVFKMRSSFAALINSYD
ncbi:MAG: hypothetical protein H6677_27990 [Candidatus Obscuribacterales bacterium]|nr:hypothetical protein [Candidatus Obscuribacterales bacterium]